MKSKLPRPASPRSKFLRFAPFLATTVLAGGTILVLSVAASASARDDLCNRSTACREAAAAEAAAKTKYATASATATAYEKKVEELDLAIASKEYEIAVNEAKIKALAQEISEKIEQLEEKQTALAELLVDAHFEKAETDSIMILASSSTISDYAEKQARADSAKVQISNAASAIKDRKAELEEDRAEQEALLAEQEAQRTELAAAREEQKALQEKYEEDAEAYNAQVIAAREEKNQAIDDLLAEQATSSNTYAGATNSYPWQDICPQQQDYFATYWNGYKIGGYVCECVSYAGWKAYEYSGLYLAFGNANTWDDNARAAGYLVDHNPAANTIGQFDSGQYGHVFWVESVNADGSINITEYNNAYSTRSYSGIFQWGDFGAQTIPAATAARYNYIHL